MNIQSFEESYSVMMDPEFRQMLRENPAAAVRELESRGHALFNPDDFDEIKVVTSTKDTMHVSLPRIPADHVLASDELSQIHAGGGSVSTAGTASSLGCMGCVCTTLSTASTAGTIATGGSAGSA